MRSFCRHVQVASARSLAPPTCSKLGSANAILISVQHALTGRAERSEVLLDHAAPLGVRVCPYARWLLPLLREPAAGNWASREEQRAARSQATHSSNLLVKGQRCCLNNHATKLWLKLILPDNLFKGVIVVLLDP